MYRIHAQANLTSQVRNIAEVTTAVAKGDLSRKITADADANRVREQHGLNVKLDVGGNMMLQSEALATFLFRAAQEILFNVIKHAYVREAVIRVRRIGRYVCISVSDSGRGFDPQGLKETSGLGLFNIRERVELLGGRMEVKSAKGSPFSLMVPDSPEVKE